MPGSDEKKSGARGVARLPRKKSGQQGKQDGNFVTPSTGTAIANGTLEEQSTEAPSNAEGEDFVNVAGFFKEYDESGPVTKKLKEDTPLAPRNSYLIECVVERLVGGLNVLFFQNPKTRANPDQKTVAYEPFMPSFRSVFFNNVQDQLLVDAMGARCDENHQFIPNKKNISDVKKMKFGWNLLLNESVSDAGDWAIHLCCCLNESEEYKACFDTQRTSDRSPFFQVLSEITPEGEPLRKLDQVMMDDGICRYLCNKFNLKNYGVRRRLKTQENWDALLKPYFQDTTRGRKVIVEYLDSQTG